MGAMIDLCVSLPTAVVSLKSQCLGSYIASGATAPIEEGVKL